MKIKSIISLLLLDFLFKEIHACLFTTSTDWALFKNGVMVPNTYVAKTDLATLLPGTITDQVGGEATIDLLPTDELELRCIAIQSVATAPKALAGSLNIMKSA